MRSVCTRSLALAPERRVGFSSPLLSLVRYIDTLRDSAAHSSVHVNRQEDDRVTVIRLHINTEWNLSLLMGSRYTPSR